MKKILISLLLLVISINLAGCSAKEQAVSQAKQDQVGYRNFVVSKLDTGNLALETKSDIPNDFACIQLAMTLQDKNLNELYSYGVELKDGSKGTKILEVNPSTPVNKVFYKQGFETGDLVEFSAIDTIFASYLCFSPQMGLNNEVKKDITNGYLDKK